jgi:hypothetical protein
VPYATLKRYDMFSWPCYDMPKNLRRPNDLLCSRLPNEFCISCILFVCSFSHCGSEKKKAMIGDLSQVGNIKLAISLSFPTPLRTIVIGICLLHGCPHLQGVFVLMRE